MARAKGTYTILVEVTDPVELDVGALGLLEFPAGYYAYTGSAFGSGGFSRIYRHRRVSTGENPTRHWHIDYLLPHATILTDYRAAGIDTECDIAGRLPGTPIPGFGASDCSCDSHLRYTQTQQKLETALRHEY